MLPEKYQFYFTGIGSYLFLQYYILTSWLRRSSDYWQHASIIDQIAKSNNKIVVFMPSTDWCDLKQRPQHLAKAFAQCGYTVIFLTKNQTCDQVAGMEKVQENLFLCSNPFLLNYIDSYALINVWPSNYPLLKYIKNYQNLIYDFPDELDFFPWISRSIVYSYHINLLARSNLVTPSASFLEEIIQKDYMVANSVVVLNGVFPEDFTIDQNAKSSIPDDMRIFVENKKPIVWFYGWLGEKWIDFQLVKYIAPRRRDYNFVFIGWWNLDQIISMFRLDQEKNLFFLGPKKYEELKYYARYFDVALIPFLINDFTMGVSPVKSFEYMVQWIPFVSTWLPECKKYQHVLLAENYDEFLLKIDNWITLRHNSWYIEWIIKEWKENTWISRVNLIINHLSYGKYNW